MTSARPVQCSNKWPIKPTGSWSCCELHTHRLWRMQLDIWKIIYFHCRERYEDMTDHRSYIHNCLSFPEYYMYLLTECEGRTGKFGSRSGRTDLTLQISILSYDHYLFIFFNFNFFFGGTRLRAAALLRFVFIFKEPMISRNSIGKPVKWIPTTSCL